MFKSKSEVMYNKKNYHEELVTMCSKFLNKKCNFPSQRCWYKHNSQTHQKVPEETHAERAHRSESVFPIQPTLTKPPELQELKEMLQQAMLMMTAVNQKIQLNLEVM